MGQKNSSTTITHLGIWADIYFGKDQLLVRQKNRNIIRRESKILLLYLSAFNSNSIDQRRL